MNTTPLEASEWADRAEVAFAEHREEAHARQGGDGTEEESASNPDTF